MENPATVGKSLLIGNSLHGRKKTPPIVKSSQQSEIRPQFQRQSENYAPIRYCREKVPQLGNPAAIGNFTTEKHGKLSAIGEIRFHFLAIRLAVGKSYPNREILVPNLENRSTIGNPGLNGEIRLLSKETHPIGKSSSNRNSQPPFGKSGIIGKSGVLSENRAHVRENQAFNGKSDT